MYIDSHLIGTIHKETVPDIYIYTVYGTDNIYITIYTTPFEQWAAPGNPLFKKAKGLRYGIYVSLPQAIHVYVTVYVNHPPIISGTLISFPM